MLDLGPVISRRQNVSQYGEKLVLKIQYNNFTHLISWILGLLFHGMIRPFQRLCNSGLILGCILVNLRKYLSALFRTGTFHYYCVEMCFNVL